VLAWAIPQLLMLTANCHAAVGLLLRGFVLCIAVSLRAMASLDASGLQIATTCWWWLGASM
jgi:hypothetical protein